MYSLTVSLKNRKEEPKPREKKRDKKWTVLESVVVPVKNSSHNILSSQPVKEQKLVII